MKTIDKIRYKLNTATVTEKLIVANVIVFLFFGILNTIFSLFQISGFAAFYEWFTFPSNPAEYIFKPWTILTYSFLHAGIFHILSNMIILYFAGNFFLNFFSPKRLLNYYFLGVIIGALVYMLSYNLFPAFAGIGRSSLVGASAGVMAVLIGVATKAPNMYIRLLIIGNVKFWWVAAFVVALDVIQIPMGNAGGHLAHLGGAALGYVYTTQLHKGNDIGAWWEKLMDAAMSLFEKREKKPKMKTVHRDADYASTAKSSYKKSRNAMSKTEKQQRIDTILDKISKSGYESLTKAEKDFLFQAGKDD